MLLAHNGAVSDYINANPDGLKCVGSAMRGLLASHLVPGTHTLISRLCAYMSLRSLASMQMSMSMLMLMLMFRSMTMSRLSLKVTRIKLRIRCTVFWSSSMVCIYLLLNVAIFCEDIISAHKDNCFP